MKWNKLILLFLILFFVACDKDGNDDPSVPDPVEETNMDPDPDNDPDNDNNPDDDSEPSELCLSVDEVALYNLIMTYREDNGLDKIPLSHSLTKVAQLHALDLEEYSSSFSPECNKHSWSDNGEWVGCCYTEDHSNPECMWDKPQELTNYDSEGYEIVSWGFTSNEEALSLWQNSNPHNELILNTSIWAGVDWNAIGIGMRGIYAVAWFGKITDPDGDVEQCP